MATGRSGRTQRNDKVTEQVTEKAASDDRIQKLVTKAIEGIESRLSKEDSLGIGDYIKVMQLQKDIEIEQPKEITVTWIDPESKDGK